MEGQDKAGRLASKNLIGSRVRQGRLDYPGKLTQDQLSGKLAALGTVLDRAAIAKIELGLRHVYDYEIAPLASALKVDVKWLLGIEP